MYWRPSSICTSTARARDGLVGVELLAAVRRVSPRPTSETPGPPQPASAAAAASASSALRGDIAGPLVAGLELALEGGLAARAIHHLALELAAGGVDVVAARAAHSGQHVGIEQD